MPKFNRKFKGNEQTADMDKDPRSVFMNHLVLTAIFTNLSASTLKTARLVCRLWESLATPYLGEICVLVPTKMFPCCKSGLTPQVNPKLVKFIRLDNHCRSGNCHMESNFMDQPDHLFWCTNDSRIVNPSLCTIFRGLATQYPTHIEEVHFRLIDEPLEYSARWRTRAAGRMKMTSYDFSTLTNLKLISILAPSKRRWGSKEIKFDKCISASAKKEKLYFFPCLVDTDYIFETITACPEHLRLLKYNESPMPTADAFKMDKEYDNTTPKTVKEVMFGQYPQEDRRLWSDDVQVPVVKEDNLVTKVAAISFEKYRPKKESRKIKHAGPPVRKHGLHQPRRN